MVEKTESKRQDADFIQLIQNHRSIRKFTDKKVSDEDIAAIIKSAQAASSSSHGQAYTVISVTDPEKKIELSQLTGNQKHVGSCSHFFVFCADLHRLEQISKIQNADMAESMDSTEMFLIATIDATLAAQNTALAAEALGLGIVYTGGIRNNPYQVSELLKLPQRVYPVFGMCIGYPDPNQIPDKKPRLPQEVICHENEYMPFNETYQYIEKYDKEMNLYYLNRVGGNRDDTWSLTLTNKRKIPRRMFMKAFLEDRGFPLK